MQRVEERLKRLEVSVRRWQRISLGLLFIGVAPYLLGGTAEKDDELTVKKLFLANEQGRVVGALTADKTGGSLLLNSTDDSRQILINADNENAEMLLVQKRVHLVTIGTSDKLGGFLSVKDSAGHRRTMAGSD